MMKCLSTFGIFLLTAFTLAAAEPNPPRKGFVAHEWGVFRLTPDADFANAELRAEWDKLPEFIYGFMKGRVVPQHWGQVEIRFRPLIFFYAEKPLQAQVTVEFPGGMPGVWYPATETPSIDGYQKQPRIGSMLRWQIGIKEPTPPFTPRNAPPQVTADHWIAQARKIKCDEIFASFGPGRHDAEREKFIFYDGLFPQGKWLKVAVKDNDVTLINQVKHPVFDITVVDRRSDKPRIGRVAKLEAGETVNRVEFTKVDETSFVSTGSRTLTEQLVTAGLYADEAALLVDSWKKDMFDTPGLHIFYRLPQSEYDARMPLTIVPKPNATVRVGLIFQGHLEPDFTERILELVKQFDSERFADRDAAMKKLLKIGPAALVQIQKLRNRADLSVEVRERIGILIKKWNAMDGFDK